MKVSAYFDDLEEVKKLFPKEIAVTGVGVTGFPRSGLSYILPNYSILSLLETSDLKAIRRVCSVVSVERDLKATLPEKYNTSEILQIEAVKEYLKDKQALFLYKASKRNSRLTKEMNLKVLSTTGEIRSVFENKKSFRLEAEKAGLRVIQGKTILVDDLEEKEWRKLREKWGERLVFQLPDYTVGGGLGTFFVDNKEDFLQFKDFVGRRRQVREIVWVNVTKFIRGREASMIGCATKYGVVCGVLQAQIMDQPELASLVGRNGVWLGHDWLIRFGEQEQKRAEAVVKKWGQYIYKKGYRGIFGLDLIIDNDGVVWPVECNARYTGAFPVYTMMQIDKGEMPIDVWHLLEWLGVDYEMNMKKVQRIYRKAKTGAQLLLHNMEKKWVTPTKRVKAGVYRILRKKQEKKGKQRQEDYVMGVEWVREGFSLLDLKNEDEFVLCDRVAQENWVLRPAERLGRLIFKGSVIDEKGQLQPEIREIVRMIYARFELMPVEVG